MSVSWVTASYETFISGSTVLFCSFVMNSGSEYSGSESDTPVVADLKWTFGIQCRGSHSLSFTLTGKRSNSSKVWEYYVKKDDVWCCNLCEMSYRRDKVSTTTMGRHLKQKHDVSLENEPPAKRVKTHQPLDLSVMKSNSLKRAIAKICAVDCTSFNVVAGPGKTVIYLSDFRLGMP